MTVQNVSGDARSGFGEDLADTINEPDETEQAPADGDSDGEASQDNPGGDQPVDPATEGDNPDH